MEELGDWKHFRCFTDSINQDEMVDFLKHSCKVLIIVFETSKIGHRPHIHATIIPHKAISTFRDDLRKKFPQIFGNKSYSINAVKNFDSNIKYCCKGTANDYPDILYTTLTDDEWKQYYNEYWKLQGKILKDKKNSGVNMGCQNGSSEEIVVKTKRVRTKTWSEKVSDLLLEDYAGLCDGIIAYHEGNAFPVPYDTLQEKLMEVILENLGKTAKNLDELILVRLYNAQYNCIIQNSNSLKAKKHFNSLLFSKVKTKLIST